MTKKERMKIGKVVKAMVRSGLYTNKEIADRLGISESAIRSCTQNIREGED